MRDSTELPAEILALIATGAIGVGALHVKNVSKRFHTSVAEVFDARLAENVLENGSSPESSWLTSLLAGGKDDPVHRTRQCHARQLHWATASHPV